MHPVAATCAEIGVVRQCHLDAVERLAGSSAARDVAPVAHEEQRRPGRDDDRRGRSVDVREPAAVDLRRSASRSDAWKSMPGYPNERHAAPRRVRDLPDRADRSRRTLLRLHGDARRLARAEGERRPRRAAGRRRRRDADACGDGEWCGLARGTRVDGGRARGSAASCRSRTRDSARTRRRRCPARTTTTSVAVWSRRERRARRLRAPTRAMIRSGSGTLARGGRAPR